MKFNRAAPFLGPFSGPKKWTAGDVPHAMCRANAASFRATCSSTARAQKFDQLADIIFVV